MYKHLERYKGRKFLLVLPTTVQTTISSTNRKNIQFPKGTRGVLTGDIMILPGKNGVGDEVILANAIADIYSSDDGEKHTVLLPFQFFTLI